MAFNIRVYFLKFFLHSILEARFEKSFYRADSRYIGDFREKAFDPQLADGFDYIFYFMTIKLVQLKIQVSIES